MTDFAEIWNLAIAEYEKQTERKLDQDNTFRKFKTLEDLETGAQQTGERFKTFRSDHHKLFGILRRCLTPLLPFVNVIQTGLGSTPYAPAALLLGAASFLLESCNKVSSAYDGVQELFEDVADITVRLGEYRSVSLEKSLKAKMVQIMAYILQIMGTTEKIIKARRIKQWARTTFIHNDEISSMMSKLKRLVESELGLVMALTYSRVGDIQTDTQSINQNVTLVQAEISELVQSQRNDRKLALSEAEKRTIAEELQSDTSAELTKKHDESLLALAKGTGLWIRDDSMFQAWEEERAPILWVFGRPGVGKTMLAARTIEVLHSKYPQHPEIPSLTSVSYLFFKDDKPGLQDVSLMLKAAAFQVSQANDRFKKHVLTVLAKGKLSSARRIWESLFLDFFTVDATSRMQSSLAYIVVDGLDEAPVAERVSFLACLEDLANRSSRDTRCRIQIAVFSRPDVRADPGFDRIGYRRQERIIEVTPERNSEDINTFMKQGIREVAVMKKLKKDKATKEYQSLAKHIYKSVQARAQGMFLWAKLVFDQINSLRSQEAIKESLASVPVGLDDMLHHVFKRLDANEQHESSYLEDLLAWVFFAYEPLYISELYVLLLLTSKQHCVLLEEDLRYRYASIFKVVGPTKEDLDTTSQDGSEAAGDVTMEDSRSEASEDSLDGLDADDSEEAESDESVTDTDTVSADDGTLESLDALQISETEGPLKHQHWHVDEVTFAHARVRDYLNTEMDPTTRRWHDCSLFSRGSSEARAKIANACLKLLLTDVSDKYGIDDLQEGYIHAYWMEHLVDAHFEDGGDHAIAAAQLLAALFHDGRRILASSSGDFDDFVNTWFNTDRFSTAIRQLLVNHMQYLEDVFHPWIQRLKTSSRVLFEPLVEECVRKWLTKSGWDDKAYLDKSGKEVYILYAYSNLNDEGLNTSGVEQYSISDAKKIPLDRMEALANLTSTAKTEHWYTGLAWTMMEVKSEAYTRRAIEYFKKALELSPQGWVALEGLAVCHGNNLGDFSTAVHIMKDALRALPANLDFVEFHLQAKMVDWLGRLDNLEEYVNVTRRNFENSREYSYSGYTAQHHILLTVKNYIEALYRSQDFDGLLDALHELDARKVVGDDKSVWLAYLQAQQYSVYDIDLFHKIGEVARVPKFSNATDFFAESIRRASDLRSETIALTTNQYMAKMGAQWLRQYSTRDESRTFCELIIQLINQSDQAVQQQASGLYQRTANMLATLYLENAFAETRAGRDPVPITASMRSLALHRQGSQQYYRASYPAMVLGMWLHEFAAEDDAEWMAAIKPSVLRALYLLTDDDPWNDQDAYSQLGAALLCANDIDNARIALGITMKPIEDAHNQVAENDKNDETSRAEDVLGADNDTTNASATTHMEAINEKYAGFKLFWSCNGTCKTEQQDYQELHFCRFCWNTCFCEKCLPLVKSGQISVVCSSDHEHVQIFPLSSDAKRIANALVEKRYGEQSNWLEEIRRRWGA